MRCYVINYFRLCQLYLELYKRELPVQLRHVCVVYMLIIEPVWEKNILDNRSYIFNFA